MTRMLTLLLCGLTACGDPGEAPELPSSPSVHVSVEQRGAVLSWDAADGAQGYTLYIQPVEGELGILSEEERRLDEAEAEIIDGVTSPLLLDAHRQCGWSYIVDVTAWNDAGESELYAGVGYQLNDPWCSEE